MGVPRLTQCCCGCTLQTGSMIIGILECIMAGLSLIMSIVSAEYLALSMENLTDPDTISLYNTMYGALIALAIFSSVELLFTIFLLIGVCQKKASFLTPWIIFAMINLVFTLISGIINVWGYASIGAAGSGVAYVIVALIFIALRIYFILVVNSLKADLQEGAMGSAQNGRA